MERRNTIIGQKFGRWTVIEKLPSKVYDGGNYSKSQWLCRCECGNEAIQFGSTLKSGRSKSCGCYNKDVRATMCGENHPRWKGGRRITKYGYVMLANAEYPGAELFNKTLEHIVVMSRHLGRSLKKGESVHHKNGIRDDNRIENLELWTKRQPTGARVSDLIEWAEKLLAEYKPEALASTLLELCQLFKT